MCSLLQDTKSVISLIHSSWEFFVAFLGVYILPTNGRYKGTEFELLPKDPTRLADQYVPKLDGNPGLNYFDSTEKVLYVVVKGPKFIEIRTTNVIQVRNIAIFTYIYALSLLLKPDVFSLVCYFSKNIFKHSLKSQTAYIRLGLRRTQGKAHLVL